MKISRAVFLLLVVSVFTQCDKPVDPAICPDSENKDWYKELISQYKPWSHEKVEINSYTYNSQMVIAVENVEPGCCDLMSFVFDCSGNEICRFGGIAGFNTCPDFATTATDKKLLFKN